MNKNMRSRSANIYQEGLGCYLFFIVFGSIFLLLGIYTALVVAGVVGVPSGVTIATGGYIGPVFAIGFGGMIVWGAIAHARTLLRFGMPEEEILPAQVLPGQMFTFRYRQPVERTTDIEFVGAYLVFRERITIRGVEGDTTKDYDRLFGKYQQPARRYLMGESIQIDVSFSLPAAIRQDLNAANLPQGKRQTMWVVKVRIHIGKNQDVWQEYKVPVRAEASPLPLLESEREPDRSYTILLLPGGGSWIRTTQAMMAALPHLRPQQIGNLYSSRPCVLVEGASEQEAQTLKTQLEATGAKVEIQPAVQLS